MSHLSSVTVLYAAVWKDNSLHGCPFVVVLKWEESIKTMQRNAKI